MPKRGGALAPACHPLTDGQRGQAEDVADDERAAVVGETGHHGLDDTVLRVRDHIGTGEPEKREDTNHDQRGQHPDHKEVRGAYREGQADAQHDEAQVEEEADPSDEGQVDDHHGERDSHAERDDLAAGLAPLFPEGSGLGHAANVRAPSLLSGGGAPVD